MADISIDRSSFPAEGGSYRINITKEDNKGWEIISIPAAAWYSVDEMNNMSPHLYMVDVTVDENDTGTQRSMSIAVTVDGQGELFSITQDSTATALSADIIAYTAGNVDASGGQVTVDIYANGGTDSLSTASVTSGSSYCSLTSTTHGVSSGGYTCTRFVFTFASSSSTSTRSATYTFTVGNGNTTATTTLTKTQNAMIVQSGSLEVANASVSATDTTANALITLSDIVTSTLAVTTTTFVFVTAASIQVSGGSYYLVLTMPTNSGSAARSETIGISATDNYGNTLTDTMTITQAGTSVTHSLSAAWRDNLGYDGVLDYAGGREDALVTYTGSWNDAPSVSTGTLPDGVTVTMPSTSVVRAEYTGGNIDETIIIPITVSREGNDSVTYSTIINLTLRASGVFPIWADTFGTIASSDDFEDYELQTGGGLLYSGRAFAYPDEQDITVNIARVVAPYLTSYYLDVDFISDNTTLGSYTFVRDYSYDTSMDYTQNLVLNAPINGRIPSGVSISATMWAASASGDLQVTDDTGTLVVNKALAKGLNTGSWISGGVGKTYTIGSEVYIVVSACQGVLLKYVNAYGAVDYFLVEGVAKKSDKITRATYEKDAPALSSEFESKAYQNTMEASWQGTTGWLTDAQSLRMRHLFESVEVYMIDVSTGDEIPVLMTDTSMDYKTWNTNGRKMVNYTLKWTESQKKLRR